MKTTHCRACGTALSRTFVDLGMTPLANSFIPAECANEAEKFYPLHVFVCENCLLVQLSEFETPEYIFSDKYAYFSSYSTSWLQHAEQYTIDMIDRFDLKPDSHVVEVASNDGYLLQWFLKRGYRVTGIEPAANCAEAAIKKGIPTEVVFFGCDSASDIAARRGKADLMAANNVLAHVPDIREFVGGFREMLAPEGVVTFEFPHLLNLIHYTQFDTIYHEHFSYLALLPVQRVLESQGLRVFDVRKLSTHGGSLRVFACKQDAVHVKTPAVSALIAHEKTAGLTDLASYDDFVGKVMAVKDALLEFLIDARRENKMVCGYGAPAKGNTMLNFCGVGSQYIPFTVDRSPTKQGTLLPGTRIPVRSVEEIDRQKPDFILILPWNLRDEISEQMSHIRQWGGRFVTAVPNLDIF